MPRYLHKSPFPHCAAPLKYQHFSGRNRIIDCGIGLRDLCVNVVSVEFDTVLCQIFMMGILDSGGIWWNYSATQILLWAIFGRRREIS